MTQSTRARAAAAARDSLPWALILASALANFAVTASGSARSPFLIDMARDLDVGLVLIANLFGLTSVAWGVASFFSGTLSDRWGRRVFLIGGPAALIVAQIGVAYSGSYWSLLSWVIFAGCCCGVFTGVSLAEVSARVPDWQRSRALGWVMSGQSLTLLIGVPLAAWIGADIGWRGVHICVGILALVSTVGLAVTVRSGSNPAPAAAATAKPSLRRALSAPVILLLVIVVAERICFGLAAVYYPTFLQTEMSLSLKAVAFPLAVFAVGNIAGTVLGGQIGDRFANRRLSFAIAMFASGAAAILLFAWRGSVELTVGFGLLFGFFNALARPPLMAMLAAVPADVRGTVMGLNSTCASVGWLGAAAIGGWLLATTGFGSFGYLIAVFSGASALAALFGPQGTAGRRGRRPL